MQRKRLIPGSKIPVFSSFVKPLPLWQGFSHQGAFISFALPIPRWMSTMSSPENFFMARLMDSASDRADLSFKASSTA
jgi:hypothetical protein